MSGRCTIRKHRGREQDTEAVHLLLLWNQNAETVQSVRDLFVAESHGYTREWRIVNLSQNVQFLLPFAVHVYSGDLVRRRTQQHSRVLTRTCRRIHTPSELSPPETRDRSLQTDGSTKTRLQRVHQHPKSTVEGKHRRLRLGNFVALFSLPRSQNRAAD